MLRKCICGPISILLNQRKLKTEQRFSRLIRAYQVVKGLWLVAYLIVRYELFPMMFESRINMSVLITLIHHSAGYPSQYNKTKGKSKLQTMKDMKLLIILGNMLARVQNQKIYTNTKILQIISNFARIQGNIKIYGNRKTFDFLMPLISAPRVLKSYEQI